MASVKCPGCGERVKAREGGERVRCPECGKSFRAPDDADEPPRALARRKGMSGTKITAIVVGSLLALALVVLAAVVIVRKGKDGETAPVDSAKVTVENFNSVKPGMDLAEVEGILGGSRSSSLDDMREEMRKSVSEFQAALDAAHAEATEGTVWRRWDGKNLRAWVAFAKTADGQRAAYSIAIEQTGGKYKWVPGFATHAGNDDLAKLNEERKREEAIRNDPKWVRGAKARELLPGEWRDEQATGHLFGPGGKWTQLDAGPVFQYDRPPTYRIVDDRFVEVTHGEFNIPAPPPPPPGFPALPPLNQGPVARRYEYLVNRDELTLIDGTPRPLFPVQTFYRMPATAGSLAEAKVVAPLLADVKSAELTRRQSAFNRLRVLGKNAATALPALTELLRSKDLATVAGAADALGAMKEAALPAVPTLVAMAREPNPKRAIPAIKALGDIGPPAREALPALRDVLNTSKDGPTKVEVLGALRAIETGER